MSRGSPKRTASFLLLKNGFNHLISKKYTKIQKLSR